MGLLVLEVSTLYIPPTSRSVPPTSTPNTTDRMLPTNTLFSVLLSLAVASAAVVPRDASVSFDLNSGSGTAVKDPAPVAVS